MMHIGSIVLAAAIIGGAYVTRPMEPQQQDAANAVLNRPQTLSEGMQGLGATIGGGRIFNDYYVATHYTVNLNDKPIVECWGAFTKVNCNRVQRDGQSQGDSGAEPKLLGG